MGNLILKITLQDSSFIETIVKMTAKYYHLEVERMLSKTRKREVVMARQIAMFFSTKYTTASLETIGKMVGDKDHATVLHAKKTVNNLRETDRSYRGRLVMLQEKIENIVSEKSVSEYDMVCIDCGENHIQSRAWINPNNKKFVDVIEGSNDNPIDNWCNDCQAHVQLLIRHEYDKLHEPPPVEAITDRDNYINRKLEEIRNEFD